MHKSVETRAPTPPRPYQGGVFEANSCHYAPLPAPPLRQRMLVKAPAKRMSANEACAHPWITKHRPRHSAAPPKDKDGLEPAVPKAQEMTERGEGKAAEAEEEEEGQSTPLDPKLVRRLRNFAVRGGRFVSGRERAGVVSKMQTAPCGIGTSRPVFPPHPRKIRGLSKCRLFVGHVWNWRCVGVHLGTHRSTLPGVLKVRSSDALLSFLRAGIYRIYHYNTAKSTEN